MNVPPGTWTADTRAENANSRPAYRKNGPKSSDRRRAQPPMTMNGARMNPAIERHEDHHGGDQPADPELEQRPEALPEELLQRRPAW